MQHRPLLQHKRDHTKLFLEIARLRDNAVLELGLKEYEFHKTPKFVTETGERLTIEPERSIVLPNYRLMEGVLPLLEKSIPGFSLVANSESGFRYPTAAIAGDDAPFIKRMRSEYFHKVDEDRSICRPVNLSYGIKSRGKGDNRLEYEVWIPDDNVEQDPLPLLINKYGEDLPKAIREFAAAPSFVYGWMGVKRGAFDALYQDKSKLGDIVLCLSLSLDAYNIGARPDLSFSPENESSIATNQAEFEWEVLGYYAPQGAELCQADIWTGIDAALAAVSAPLEDAYSSILIPTENSKTERILEIIGEQGVELSEIAELNLQPHEFLQTTSRHRMKGHDASRTVNLLGRLNRLFYQPEFILPSLQELHDVIAKPK